MFERSDFIEMREGRFLESGALLRQGMTVENWERVVAICDGHSQGKCGMD